MPNKPCKEGKIRNENGRCVKIKVEKECGEGRIKNPKTNKCDSITGNIGKKILERQQPCPEGEIRNPKTNKCVSITGTIGKKILQKQQPCPEGKIRNENGRCVKIDPKEVNRQFLFDLRRKYDLELAKTKINQGLSMRNKPNTSVTIIYEGKELVLPPLNKLYKEDKNKDKEFDYSYIPDINYIPSDREDKHKGHKNKFYKINTKKAQEILLNFRKSIGKIDGFEDYEKADYEYFGRSVYLPPIRKKTKVEKKKEKEAEKKMQEQMEQQRIIDQQNLNRLIETTRIKQDLALRIPIDDIYDNFTHPLLKSRFKQIGA